MYQAGNKETWFLIQVLLLTSYVDAKVVLALKKIASSKVYIYKKVIEVRAGLRLLKI